MQWIDLYEDAAEPELALKERSTSYRWDYLVLCLFFFSFLFFLFILFASVEYPLEIC